MLGMLKFLNSISETAIRKLKSDIHCTGVKEIVFFFLYIEVIYINIDCITINACKTDLSAKRDSSVDELTGQI